MTATTFRKIAKDSGTGADSERVKLKLTVEVESVDFDAEGVWTWCWGVGGGAWSGVGEVMCPERERGRGWGDWVSRSLHHLCARLLIHVLIPPPSPNVGGTIRLRGKNLTENDHVKLGAYHTLELEMQRAFTLFKHVWDALDVDRVKQATDPTLSADLAAVLITVGWAVWARRQGNMWCWHLCEGVLACVFLRGRERVRERKERRVHGSKLAS